MQYAGAMILSSTASAQMRPLSGEEAMNNQCACCRGKFGMVRHRRAFKAFCSQRCVDHHRVWLRAEARKRKGWLDCLWSASLNVIPYATEPPSA
jgi:endogenous inhibitor of DNA gyrase (YacG/DUF329 family)